MNPLQTRRRTLAITSVTGVLLIGLIVVLLNVLANWVYARWDLTSSGAYSLSPSSKTLMRRLEDRIVIKAYFTPDLPPPYNTYERYVRDILTEYRAAARGRLQFEFIPTHPPASFEQEAAGAGMMPIQFEQMGSDQLAIHRGFMGLSLFYGDKSEAMPVIKDIQTLEYDLTSRIARLTLKSKKTILLTTGHGETAWRGDTHSRLAQDVAELYTLQDVSLQPATTAPLQGDALFVIGSRIKFDEKALWVIDQAIMHGIPTAFLVDNKNVMVQRFMVGPFDNGLNELLKHYGANVGSQLVLDQQSETVGFSQNYNGMAITSSVRYPFIPVIAPLDKKNPILRGLQAVAVPFTVAVEGAPPAGVQFTPLLRTTSHSWLAPPQTYNLGPNAIPPPPHADEPHGPYTVGGVLDGVFTSYFQGKASPFPDQALVGTSPRTQIFVLGTSHVVDPAMPQFPGMEAFLTNVMAALSHDDTLLGIRAKGEILRPLRPIGEAARQAIKLFSILGVAVLPALVGLVRWRKRGQWRQSVRAQFASAPAAPPVPPLTPLP